MDDLDAMACLQSLARIFRAWDDCWDGDNKLGKEGVDGAWGDLAFELSRNSFFVKHGDVLRAMIFISWNAWMDSNEWADSTNPKKKEAAWHIREYCNEILPLFAWLIGGRAHARSISLRARESYLEELIESE